jgi:four helix bundle protein
VPELDTATNGAEFQCGLKSGVWSQQGRKEGKKMIRFEKLEVWRKAVEYADVIYRASRSFPDAERFGLTNQMRRAAVSVSSNVAEGSGRSSDTEFARFVEIAYGSLMETVSQSYIAKAQGFLPHVSFDEVYRRADELARMLSGLRTSLLSPRSR